MTMAPLDEEIKKIASLLETASRFIHQGKTVELSALHEKVQNLCASIAKLPRPQAKEFLPHIEKLLESLERVEKDVDLQHDGVMQRLQFNSSHANPLFAQEVRDDDDTE